METRRTCEMWKLDEWIIKIEQVPLDERSNVLFLWTKNNEITIKQFEELIKYCL